MSSLLADPRLVRYAELVRASPHNLVSPRAAEELLSRHIPECVAFAAALPRELEVVADLGSGGGLPGLVLAMVRPELSVTLIEATGKKARFLEETAADLDLAVHIVNGRAEEHEQFDLTGAFDAVTARAVAPLAKLVPWVRPLLVKRGLLFAIKGDRWQEELQEARPLLKGQRLEVVETPEAGPFTGVPRGTAALPEELLAHAPRVVTMRRFR